MLAACDTFRSGAVEQLKTHAKRLNVDVYEKGYRSDPTSIASDALKYGMSITISYYSIIGWKI
jgi:signal recognition particle receptor subunit alpha